MKITIKAKMFELLPGERIQITTDVENFKEVLREHSPNLLIDYLNEEHGTAIPHLPYKRKEANNDSI